jgi:regulatory protein
VRISDIKTQVKDPLRENIYLDGKFGFGISAEARFLAKLQIGQEIDEDQVKQLVFQDQVGKLYIFAQRFLSYRPRSSKEMQYHLRKKLEKGEYVNLDTILDEVIRKLEKLGLINDEEFARWWIEQRQKFRPKGERVLRNELHQKGVPREVIDEIFYAYESPQNEIEKIARKKLASYAKLPEPEFRRKMSEFLARRGYDWDEIRSVVDTLLRERLE